MSEFSSRIPPHNLDAERAVLGCVLLEGASALQRVGALGAGEFYTEGHRTIFARMIDLATREEPIDVLTLSEALRRADELEFVGGAPALAHALEQASIGAHLPRYAAIVREHATLRDLIRTSSQVITEAFDAKEDAQLVLARAREVFDRLERRAAVAESPFPALTGAQLMALEIPDPVFVLEKWIPAQGLTFIVGDSEAFKSWFADVLSICIAAGLPLFDTFPTVQTPTLVISEENGLPEDKRRCGLLFRGLGVDPAAVPWHIASETSFRFDDGPKYAAMRAYVQQHGIKVIICDSFVRMHRKEEKDAGDMNALYMERMKPLIREGCALLMLHHKRKAPAGVQAAAPSDNDDIRGSGDLRAAAQAVIFLKAAGVDKAIVKHNKARGWKKQDAYVFGMKDIDDGQRLAVVMTYEGAPAAALDKTAAAWDAVLTWAHERGVLGFDRAQLLQQFKGVYSKKVLDPILKEKAKNSYPLKRERIGRRDVYTLVDSAVTPDDAEPGEDVDVPF